jgi:hypothetical protein
MQYRSGRGLRRASWLVAALLMAASAPAQADTNQFQVSAVVLSRSVCRFLTAPTTLDFGTINPASGTNATATTTIRFWCLGSQASTTYSVQAGNGLYSPGPGLRRVRHATSATDLMAYNLNISPASGTIGWLATQTITVTGTIVPTEFQNARVGAYSDTVVIDLDP